MHSWNFKKIISLALYQNYNTFPSLKPRKLLDKTGVKLFHNFTRHHTVLVLKIEYISTLYWPLCFARLCCCFGFRESEASVVFEFYSGCKRKNPDQNFQDHRTGRQEVAACLSLIRAILGLQANEQQLSHEHLNSKFQFCWGKIYQYSVGSNQFLASNIPSKPRPIFASKVSV